jgi:hypothetical protein
MFLVDMNSLTGARIAPDTRIAFLDGKGTEAAQLDPVAPRHGGRDLVKYGIYDPLNVSLVQMWIVVCDLLDQL